MAHSNAHCSDCWAIRTRTLIRRGYEVLGEDIWIWGVGDVQRVRYGDVMKVV